MKNRAPIASVSILSEFTEIKVWLGAFAVKKTVIPVPKSQRQASGKNGRDTTREDSTREHYSKHGYSEG